MPSQVFLEPLEEHHAPELFESLRDPRLYEYMPEDPPTSVEALANRYRFLSGRKSPDGTEHWLNWVVRRPSGEAVGTLQATVEPDGTAYVAYVVFSRFWRQGFAAAGMRNMLDLLRRDYEAAGFVALVDTRNVASIGLLESLGFVRTDFRPQADTFKGSISDEYEYRMAVVR